AVKSLAASRPELQHEAREFDPDPMLLGLPDGQVLDLGDGSVRAITPADLITRRLPVAPASTESAEWLEFLETTHPDQSEVVAFLKRWFGYCLTASVKEDKLLFFLGVGGAGKGTTVEPFSVLLGPYFYAIPIAMLLEDTGEDRRLNYIANLRGARLAVCNEGSKMRKLDSRGIKALTGGGEITGRRLCHQPASFVQTHKILVLANDEPVLDLDDAMKQRVLIVRFDQKFRDTPRDKKGLRDFFKTPEQLAGILRWAIEGCREWQEKGLQPPEEVRNASSEYFQSADFFQQFLDEHTELDMVGFVGTELLYRRWCMYVETNGLPWSSKGTSKTFVTDLKARCPNIESGVRLNGVRGLRGIKIREQEKEKF
ncbi:MAG TPA: phage/plasmid primase, P4 family, partial [Nitrospira sp.]|nr:phage/plasmid primase, P4 family [Nitrospira sp.]